MKHLLTLILCVLLFELCYAAVYTDTWAVHIEGGDERAVELAEKHGFQYLGKVRRSFPEIFVPCLSPGIKDWALAGKHFT